MTASNAARPAPRLPIGALALLAAVAVAVAVAVLAGGLRLHKIDAQSFWYDEGNSARIAERSLQLIVEGAAGDIHPPFYYVLLHYWRAAFGESEAALRALSAACGVLLVLFTGLIARSMFDRRTGLIAAVLMAVSPFAVYYSQEARMYMLLALEAGVSTWALVALVALERQDARGKTSPLASCLLLAACYTLATAAGLYTQYAYPFVMVAQGLCVLVWFFAARQPGTAKLKAILAYAAMNLAAIALFLPWLPTAIHQVTGWAVAPQTVDLRAAILDAYRWIVVGRTLPLDQAALPMLAVGALALIGLVPFRTPIPVEPLVDGEAAAPDGSREPAWLWPACLLILAVVPFALLFAFNLYRESYLKFLLVCALPVSILAARGIAVLSTAWRRPSQGRVAGVASAAVSIGLTVGLALLLLPSLDHLYNNPAYARDDYRGIARMIQADARPGDAVLFNAPNQWEVFTYYHRPGELAAAIPLTYHPADDASVDAQMRPIAEENDRLFVLYYGERESDPEGRYERWLAGHAFKADEQWVGNLRLAVYGARAANVHAADGSPLWRRGPA